MTGTTKHASDRISERLVRDCGFSTSTARKTAHALGLIAQQIRTRSAAVRFSIGEAVNEAWGDRSNGDTVVAIIRDRRVVTVMLRRSTQPFTPQALGVEAVQAF